MNREATNGAIGHAGNASVPAAYANQVDYCRANDAPITARIVGGIARLLAVPDPGAFLARIRDWPGHALADGLPLRSAGALHGALLAGDAAELGPIYADLPADDATLLLGAARRLSASLLPWLDGPPQTNEAGRSAGFVAAMLWLADQGLPPRFDCLEIGSSAGINLMLDRYGYDLGGVQVGPRHPAMGLTPEWRGGPPPDRDIAIANVKGCDVAPVDLTDPAQARRLKAYVWPEHRVRFERLEAAIAAARTCPPDLVKMNAADFVEAQLALPQADGTTRVLMHSIVWQYVPPDQRRRIEAAMQAHGARATATRALAQIALEADRTLMAHGLRVRFWPGGEEARLLAEAHAHGAWIKWV